MKYRKPCKHDYFHLQLLFHGFYRWIKNEKAIFGDYSKDMIGDDTSMQKMQNPSHKWLIIIFSLVTALLLEDNHIDIPWMLKRGLAIFGQCIAFTALVQFEQYQKLYFYLTLTYAAALACVAYAFLM